MTILRVGIAGYGVVGKRRRVCVDQHSSLELVGVCDQSFKENGEWYNMKKEWQKAIKKGEK